MFPQHTGGRKQWPVQGTTLLWTDTMFSFAFWLVFMKVHSWKKHSVSLFKAWEVSCRFFLLHESIDYFDPLSHAQNKCVFFHWRLRLRLLQGNLVFCPSKSWPNCGKQQNRRGLRCGCFVYTSCFFYRFCLSNTKAEDVLRTDLQSRRRRLTFADLGISLHGVQCIRNTNSAERFRHWRCDVLPSNFQRCPSKQSCKVALSSKAEFVFISVVGSPSCVWMWRWQTLLWSCF